MSSEHAVVTRGLGKAYAIGAADEKADTLVQSLARRLRHPFGRGDVERVWALRDLDLEVRVGEVVGIVGRNGAGKSTLLKILSRITHPTEGRAELRGRAGALLEVGTGFHRELTGRENIYLNGAILGMRRDEIDRRFDEIVAFAGTERFLDTPVKRYSSGMYVRLAFAVAAHLDPEILIVDEVLSVGDADFQRRCLGKMHEVAGGGRTVLFVSHNMPMVRALCSRAIVLRDGRMVLDGDPDDAVDHYLDQVEESAERDLADREDRSGRGGVRLTGARVASAAGDGVPVATGGGARFEFDVSERKPGLALTFTLYDPQGTRITSFDTRVASPEDIHTNGAGGPIRCELDELPLVQGRYRVNVALSVGDEVHDHVEAALVFDVAAGVLRGRPITRTGKYGAVAVPHRWHLPGGPC
ncbi:MAG: ABC transporter ATP-binding protein [Gemmatimonadota bacterium]|nr:ABC transporter ATP-binding protein [Gemmatimonadota bacterium]